MVNALLLDPLPLEPAAYVAAAHNIFGSEFCMPELVELAREVLASDKTVDTVIITMARELGLQRLRETSRGRFEKAMGLAATK